MTVIAIHDGKGKIVDVDRYAETEDQHEKGCTEEGEAHADPIAQEFERFLDRACE